MKIRIYDDSIRLRLDRSEVEQIGSGEPVICKTRFGDGNEFVYQLSLHDEDDVAATFSAGCVSVMLPVPVARHWAGTETEISIRGEQSLDDGALSLLIEKDFECLDPREGEDQSNRFKNPKAAY